MLWASTQLTLSQSVNPGLMKTELQQNSPPPQRAIMVCYTIIATENFTNHCNLQKILFKGPHYGAYSELYAGLSPDIKFKEQGGFIIPWGRPGQLPEDIAAGLKAEGQGGSGAAEKFWRWCEAQTQSYK